MSDLTYAWLLGFMTILWLFMSIALPIAIELLCQKWSEK